MNQWQYLLSTNNVSVIYMNKVTDLQFSSISNSVPGLLDAALEVLPSAIPLSSSSSS